MIHPDHHEFKPEPQQPAPVRLHPVEYILLGSVAVGLLAFLGLAWRALT